MKKVVSNNIGLPVVSLPAAVQDNNIINPLTTFDDPFKVLDFLLSRTVEQIAAISEDVKEEDEQNSTFLNIFYDGVEHTKQRLEIIAKAYIDLTFTKNGR